MKVFPLPDRPEGGPSDSEDRQKGIDPATGGVYNSPWSRDVLGDDQAALPEGASRRGVSGSAVEKLAQATSQDTNRGTW